MTTAELVEKAIKRAGGPRAPAKFVEAILLEADPTVRATINDHTGVVTFRFSDGSTFSRKTYCAGA